MFNISLSNIDMIIVYLLISVIFVIIGMYLKEVYNKTKEGQKASINLISMQGKETFYEKCGFRKIPFDFTGYGMIRRIKK